MVATAFEIESGQELERFQPNEVIIDGCIYYVLTGHEGTGRCFWCGGELKGKLKRYCYGHMKEYYRHFGWPEARRWCCRRQEGICANCGTRPPESRSFDYYSLEVHHIVPLRGRKRDFSAFNIPWNLIGFCHECHKFIHAIMRDASKPISFDSFEKAKNIGQLIFKELQIA